MLINIVVYNIFNELRRKKAVTRIWLEEQTEQTIRKELRHQRPIKRYRKTCITKVEQECIWIGYMEYT